MNISLDLLKRCPIQLRPVRKDTLEYVMLRDSVHDLGIKTPLLVRPKEVYYEVIDGSHRLEVAHDLRIHEVPCHIIEVEDSNIRLVQIAVHESCIKTEPVFYYRSLWQIINIEKSMTLNEMATYLRWHPDRVKRILSLVNITPTVDHRLAKGDLSLEQAVEIGKLPVQHQDDMLSLLGTMNDREYTELVRREARKFRYGKKLGPRKKYRFRPLREVENEYLNPVIAASVIYAMGAKTLLEAFRAGIGWVLKADPASVEKDQREELKKAEKESALLEARIAKSLSHEESNE